MKTIHGLIIKFNDKDKIKRIAPFGCVVCTKCNTFGKNYFLPCHVCNGVGYVKWTTAVLKGIINDRDLSR